MPDNQKTVTNCSSLDYFIICGLGSLGQHCILSLAEFGVKIIAIEQQLPIAWEIESLEDYLEDLVIGDCRHNSILEQGMIQKCRAALIVTTDERVNIETAIAIRQLNPSARLVVRSGKANLNQLLSQQLDNYIAFASTELSTNAFALAALGNHQQEEILGFFELEGQTWQIHQRKITFEDSWYGCNLLSLTDNSHQVLSHQIQDSSLLNLGNWNGKDTLRVGDTIVYLKVVRHCDLIWLRDYEMTLRDRYSSEKKAKKQNWLPTFMIPWRQILKLIPQLNFRQQIRRVALVNGIILVNLLIFGIILFRWYYPEITTLSAFFATAILLLGGYGDLFAELEDLDFIPWWLRLFSLILTIVGTVFVGVIYALLTETLLSSRFEFSQQPPPIPQQDHIVIVGMGKTGQKIQALLTKFRQKLVGISFDGSFTQQYNSLIPLIKGNLETVLTKANLSQAKSIVIVTDDEILNLETALMAKAISPELNLVLKTSGIRISRHLKKLLPTAKIIGVYAAAAAAFAGAAFGENIINLFRLGEQTILVTEYYIEATDTLSRLLLADIAYGYGVVPILYQQPHRPAIILPLDELPLKEGDRLVVLATIEGLRRIEQGLLNLAAKSWQIKIERALTTDAIFDGANVISRITGCSLMLARETMNNLPQILPISLYHNQACRLVKELKKSLVASHLIN